MANSRPQSLDSSSTLLQSTIFGLKVFMDAHQPVTLKEGDRYPLGPPYKNTLLLIDKPVINLIWTGVSTWRSKDTSVFLYGSFI